MEIITKIKSLFKNQIPYYPLIENGDSSPYFGNYEGQIYGPYDTSCCWDFSACEIVESRLEMLIKLGLLPSNTIQWLKENNYIDSDGDFYLSRRWIAILNGARRGSEQIKFWQIAKQAGLISNNLLPYSNEEAFKNRSQSDFENEYFNIDKITGEMEIQGSEFLNYFTINAEIIASGFLNDISIQLQTYLKEGSLQIAIPVPKDGSWNRSLVRWSGHTEADHSVELYKFTPELEYPFFIYDTAEPHLKQLHKDYFITEVTRVSIIPKQISTNSLTWWQKFWSNIYSWISNKTITYPTVPVGTISG